MLKFSFTNRKLNELAQYLGLPKKAVCTFDLPAGWTCPQAMECKAYAHKVTGKLTDGYYMKYRCYAASAEAAFTSVRKLRWHNFEILRGLNVDDAVAVIEASLPVGLKVLRLHSSGDFYKPQYFQAWVRIAEMHPEITFFGYTKIAKYVNAVKPDNFRLVYSFGGFEDKDITNEPVAYVVKSVADVGVLPVACQANPSDDYDYVMAGVSFALVLHGTQPKRVS